MAANLILSSLILTTNTSDGRSVVLPTPAKPSVAAIPTAPELPVPTCVYVTFSPVTKK